MTGYRKDLLYAAAPAFLYTILINVVHTLFQAAGVSDSGMVLQALSSAVSLLFFVWYAFRCGLFVRFQSRQKSVYRYPASFCYVSAVVLCGVANNYIYMILQSALGLSDTGYERVAQNFYQQELLIEIAALCVLGPLAEEIVYRGFVYQRLREKGSETLAAVCSALLFGVMHFNLVQCAYAFVLGILLAHIVNRTGSLLTAAAAHMAANLVSVLWTETDWLELLNQAGLRQYAAAVLSVLFTGMFLSYGNQMSRRSGQAKQRTDNGEGNRE